MVQSRQLQATHCRGEPAWKGQWRDAKGRTWYVEACRRHALFEGAQQKLTDQLDALRESTAAATEPAQIIDITERRDTGS